MYAFGMHPRSLYDGQMITPLVYDESVSYEQQLAMMRGYMDELKNFANSLDERIQSLEAYEKRIGEIDGFKDFTVGEIKKAEITETGIVIVEPPGEDEAETFYTVADLRQSGVTRTRHVVNETPYE